MLKTYLARQPIFDGKEELAGYELLYRHGRHVTPHSEGNQNSTEDSILDYIQFGLTRLVGNQPAYIKVKRDFIMNHEQLPPPVQPLVLVLFEDVESDDEFIAAIRALIKKGYQFALADFRSDKKYIDLARLASVVKIEIDQCNVGTLIKLVASLKRQPAKLLAEKVETIAQYEQCRKLGFDYYQGYFICQPKIVRVSRPPINQHYVMQLLAKLQSADVGVKELEKIIEHDVTLSYKILLYLNSATFSLRNKIESIRHAVVFLGFDEIRKFASMIALSGIEGKSSELIRITLLRAKMCELLCNFTGQGNEGTAYMVGLFSTLDAMMDAPLNDLLALLPISEDIKNALLYRSGPYSELLICAIAYEKGNWKIIEDAGFNEAVASSCYFQAVEWSNESSVQLTA